MICIWGKFSFNKLFFEIRNIPLSKRGLENQKLLPFLCALVQFNLLIEIPSSLPVCLSVNLHEPLASP